MRPVAGDGGRRRSRRPDRPRRTQPRQRRLPERLLHEGTRQADGRPHLALGRRSTHAEQLYTRPTSDVLHLAAVHDDDHQRDVVSQERGGERPGGEIRTDRIQRRDVDSVTVQQSGGDTHQPGHRAVLPPEQVGRLDAGHAKGEVAEIR